MAKKFYVFILCFLNIIADDGVLSVARMALIIAAFSNMTLRPIPRTVNIFHELCERYVSLNQKQSIFLCVLLRGHAPSILLCLKNHSVKTLPEKERF